MASRSERYKTRPRAASAMDHKQVQNQLKREFNGFAFTPSRTPRPLSQTPWYSLVVAQSIASPKESPYELTYNCGAIWLAAELQLGIGTTFPAELRFQRVEVWNTTASGEASVALFPYSLGTASSTTTTLFNRRFDHAGKNQWACAGFEWPRSQQNYVHESATQTPVFAVRTGAGTQAVYTRIHVLWRPTSGSVPSVRGAFEMV